MTMGSLEISEEVPLRVPLRIPFRDPCRDSSEDFCKGSIDSFWFESTLKVS